MSRLSTWILIAVVVLGAAIAGWAARGLLWGWLLSLHGH